MKDSVSPQKYSCEEDIEGLKLLENGIKYRFFNDAVSISIRAVRSRINYFVLLSSLKLRKISKFEVLEKTVERTN